MSSEAKSQLFGTEPRRFSQERSRRTFEKLITAATDVFADRGFDASQTPDIAASADVSVGTFYRYFSDKREVFLEVIRRHLEAANASVLPELTPDRFVGAGRRQTIRIAFDILVEHITKRPGLQRAFLEMSMRDEDVAKLRAQFEGNARKQLAVLIATVCPRKDVADPEAMAYIIQTSAVECTVALTGTRGTPPIPAERASSALIDVIFRALFGFEHEA